MEFSRKNLLLSSPVFFVELATMWNLLSYYVYHEPLIPALLLATSFSVLLIATAVLVSQDLGWVVRTLLITGGILLFFIQAASNISEAYLRGQTLLPVTYLATLWGVSPENWLLKSSFLWGGVINLVGGLYWLALGVHFRQERRWDQMAAAELNDLLNTRK